MYDFLNYLIYKGISIEEPSTVFRGLYGFCSSRFKFFTLADFMERV